MGWESEGQNYDPHPERSRSKLVDAVFAGSPSLGAQLGRALAMSAMPVIRHRQPSLIYQNWRLIPGTHWPHRDPSSEEVAWPTLSVANGSTSTIRGSSKAASLPTQSRHHVPAAKYPLRIYGGHNRWSIHAIWRDVKLLLRLQRGQPVRLGPNEAAKRGIRTATWRASLQPSRQFECMVRVAAVAARRVIVYHAWEPYQFKELEGNQGTSRKRRGRRRILAAATITSTTACTGGPGHAPRGMPVEIEKVGTRRRLIPQPVF